MTAGSGNFELDGMVIRLNLRAVAFFAFPYTEKNRFRPSVKEIFTQIMIFLDLFLACRSNRRHNGRTLVTAMRAHRGKSN